ncbi:hypothetical protein IFM89_003547 [Coptis chinensis]|uniref:Ubiquitin carboxyl-terminal hydrolase n=1 Tax=Coptis chinensis TaxID=261450 RepID=A0A835M8W1_9MAGN|nr:hypothetical protein IFM89_003547 [Coptis chinensis]
MQEQEDSQLPITEFQDKDDPFLFYSLDEDDDDEIPPASNVEEEPPLSVIINDTSSKMMGAGLRNLGNTCFLNSILQCFNHTVPFVQSLRNWNHSSPCLRSRDGFCVLCELRDHIELSLSSSGRSVSPYGFVDNLSYLSSGFRRYEQEDAHEFLQCLLDKLDSCSIVDASAKDEESASSVQDSSLVNKIFGGRLQSKLRCCECGHSSDTFEPLVDLSLEIENVDSLPNALKSFTNVEKIEETKFACENCKKDVLVEKQFTLEQTPSVAAFHLKRFKNDGSYVEKIDKYVEFPLELDLQPFSGNQENDNVESKYELYAVVVHTGLTSCSGHYFCFIRSSPQTWHKLDDSKVTKVAEDFVLSQEAYIIFYARQGTPWFSTLMETQVQRAITSPKSVLDDVDASTTAPNEANTVSGYNFFRNYAEKIPVTTSPKPVLVDVDAACTTVPIKAIPFSGSKYCVRNYAEKVPAEASLDLSREKFDKASENVDVWPPTPPPRSPSPDLYFEDPPETLYRIPVDHLEPKYHTPCNKASNKAVEDAKMKEAIRLTRSMPSSRAKRLRTLLGSQSEGAISKKRRMTAGSGGEKSSPSGAYRKINPSIGHSIKYLGFFLKLKGSQRGMNCS